MSFKYVDIGVETKGPRGLSCRSRFYTTFYKNYKDFYHTITVILLSLGGSPDLIAFLNPCMYRYLPLYFWESLKFLYP